MNMINTLYDSENNDFQNYVLLINVNNKYYLHYNILFDIKIC